MNVTGQRRGGFFEVFLVGVAGGGDGGPRRIVLGVRRL